MAERSDIKRMNIIQKTSLWYRLERIGQEPKKEEEPIYQDMEWTPKQWDTVQQLKGQVLYLQGKVNEHTDKKKEQGESF